MGERNNYHDWKPKTSQKRYNPQTCKHEKCTPKFDKEACNGHDSYWVRKNYPRFEGTCPDCGLRMIMYADEMQYLMGDY